MYSYYMKYSPSKLCAAAGFHARVRPIFSLIPNLQANFLNFQLQAGHPTKLLRYSHGKVWNRSKTYRSLESSAGRECRKVAVRAQLIVIQ
jgi:hypothetical protein